MNSSPAIPDHTLLRAIGRGAYGEVWLARNVMGTLRAVKIIWRQHFESDRPYEREFAGIQRYEPVSHSTDGLVHVLHVGRNDADGYFYYVMELADSVSSNQYSVISQSGVLALPPGTVAGSLITDPRITDYSPKTLHSDLKRLGRLPTVDCLRLALDVVSGLAQLHQHGLVHRDVKPGNIIYVNGRAKLADIGLVSAGGEGRTFVGTEGYIPPEGPGSPAADLYGLGVVLYEASTGLSPERFPDVPPAWFADSAGDEALELHEVTLKACEGQRERRYQSAEEMQADLALLQSGQSVRRVRALERRLAWARRIGWAAALIVAAAIAGVLFAGWRARVAEQTSAREAALRQRAQRAEKDAEQKLYAAYLAQARATVVSGEFGRRFRTLEAVRQAAAIRSTPELRREVFAALALPDFRLEREIDFGRAVNGIWVDPAFTRYAVSPRRADVEIYSLSDNRRLQILSASTNLNAQVLRFSSDGHYLAFKRDHGSGNDSDLEVWDLVATQRVVLARHAAARNAIAFHPTAPRLLVGRPSGRLVTWDLSRGIELMSWQLPQHRSVCYSPDGNRFAVSYDRGRAGIVEVRDATNASLLATASFPGSVHTLSWAPDGRHLAVPCTDFSVSLFDAQDGTVRILGHHKAQAVLTEFSPDGNFLFSGGWDNEVNVWNLRNFQRELTAALGSSALQFSADGRKGALLMGGQRLQILEFSRSAECRELAGDPNSGGRLGKFSVDGRWLAVPAMNGLAVWDLARPDTSAAVYDRQGIGGVDFVAETGELYGFSESRLLHWGLTPGPGSNAAPILEPLPLPATKHFVQSAHLLRKRQIILSTGPQGIHFTPLTNTVAASEARRKGSCWISAVSAGEDRLAVAFWDQPVVRVFRLPELTPECWLTNAARVWSLAFAPDGKTLAVLTTANLCLWDATRWQVKRTQAAAADVFGRVEYSSAGGLLVLTESARTAALLDANTLEPLLPLPAWIRPLALSPDSRRLAVVVEGRRVQLWDLVAVRARFRELGVDWQD